MITGSLIFSLKKLQTSTHSKYYGNNKIRIKRKKPRQF